MGRRLAPVAVAVAVVAVDQTSKTWALDHLTDRNIHLVWTLRLALTFNSGVAFGLGRGSASLVIALGVVVLVGLLGFGRSVRGRGGLPAAVAVGLLLGGAVGNLADRLVRHHHGAVIDFIDLRWWPVFNLADASIVCGALLLVLAGGRRSPP